MTVAGGTTYRLRYSTENLAYAADSPANACIMRDHRYTTYM